MRIGLTLAAILFASSAFAQSVQTTGTSTTSTGAVKVTVNQPPEDVQAGPQSFTGAGNLSVSSQGSGSTGVVVSGTFTGAAWTIQGSVDSTNGTNGTWANIPFWDNTNAGVIYNAQPSATATSTFVFGSAGYAYVRIHVTAVSTGTLVATLNASAGSIQPAVGVQGTSTNITGVNGVVPNPCFGQAKLTADFEATSSGGSIITAASSKKAYICGIRIHTSAAANISLIEGTGSSVCTGGTTAGVYLNTGVTAANGAAYGANGGDAVGFANDVVALNATANQNICVAFTTTNSPQVNVHVSYVQQ